MSGTGVGGSYGDLLVTSLVVLGAVCIAAFLAVRLFGRVLAGGLRGRGSGHLLDVVARVPLEPRRSLYVVEVAGKTLLVGTSEMGLSVLSELDGAEVKARSVAQPSFGDLVRSAWSRRRSLGDAGASTTRTSSGDGTERAVERGPEHADERPPVEHDASAASRPPAHGAATPGDTSPRET